MPPWRRWTLLILSVGFASASADSADPPARPPNAPGPAIAPPMRSAPIPPRGGAPAQDESWPERQREAEQLRQLQAWRAYVNRPTAWQLQNPSGAQNRSPTDVLPRGYVMSNTYAGPQHREWSNVSAPVMLPQMPAGYVSVPPVPSTNVPLAPNTYWGPANQSWSNVRVGTAVPNGLGGWNYTPR